MTIKLLTCFVSQTKSRNTGEVFSIDDAEGQRLIDAGFAEFVPQTPVKTETATAPTPTTETATIDSATPVIPATTPAVSGSTTTVKGTAK